MAEGESASATATAQEEGYEFVVGVDLDDADVADFAESTLEDAERRQRGNKKVTKTDPDWLKSLYRMIIEDRDITDADDATAVEQKVNDSLRAFDSNLASGDIFKLFK